MELTKTKINFNNSGYYFIALLVVVLLGFWPSYFGKFISGTNKYSFYFHFHAAMMSCWVLLLIIQPVLIKKKKLALHRLTGRLSYLIMPLLFLSVILLAHNRMQDHILVDSNIKYYGPHLVIPFKDLLIIGVAYFIAIRWRRDVNIHARAMVSTGIVFIEPALVRFIRYALIPVGPGSFFWTIGLVYALLIALIILERKQKRGRWVFPVILGLYIVVHGIIIFQINPAPWENFARWFAALPLT